MKTIASLLILSLTACEGTDGADGAQPLDGGPDGGLCAMHCVEGGTHCPPVETWSDLDWPPRGCGFAPCFNAVECEGVTFIDECEVLTCEGAAPPYSEPGWCVRQRGPECVTDGND